MLLESNRLPGYLRRVWHLWPSALAPLHPSRLLCLLRLITNLPADVKLHKCLQCRNLECLYSWLLAKLLCFPCR
jgi:hypothetical protein